MKELFRKNDGQELVPPEIYKVIMERRRYNSMVAEKYPGPSSHSQLYGTWQIKFVVGALTVLLLVMVFLLGKVVG